MFPTALFTYCQLSIIGVSSVSFDINHPRLHLLIGSVTCGSRHKQYSPTRLVIFKCCYYYVIRVTFSSDGRENKRWPVVMWSSTPVNAVILSSSAPWPAHSTFMCVVIGCYKYCQQMSLIDSSNFHRVI